MKKDPFVDKIEQAKQKIAVAEEDLEKILGAIVVLPRAEKTMVSEAIRDAFDKLNAAKANLIDIETLLLADKT